MKRKSYFGRNSPIELFRTRAGLVVTGGDVTTSEHRTTLTGPVWRGQLKVVHCNDWRLPGRCVVTLIISHVDVRPGGGTMQLVLLVPQCPHTLLMRLSYLDIVHKILLNIFLELRGEEGLLGAGPHLGVADHEGQHLWDVGHQTLQQSQRHGEEESPGTNL